MYVEIVKMEETTTDETNGIYLAGMEHQTTDSICLTGCWFVHFGLDILQGKMEGSRIITLKGNFNPDNLIDTLTDAIYETLPDNAKAFVDNSGQRIAIRAFNRI